MKHLKKFESYDLTQSEEISNCHYSCKVSNDELVRFFKKDLDTKFIPNHLSSGIGWSKEY